ncbi:MAG: hypothetical protein ACFCUH_13775 [Flavobacteriales bacterium]
MARKLLFSLFAVFLAWQSYSLITLLIRTDANGYSLLNQGFLAVLVNLYVTGIFAFAGFAWPTYHLLPEGYYRIRNHRWVKNVGKAIGLSLFRSLLLAAFWGKSKNRKRFFDGTRSGLAAFDRQTRQAEFGHLGALVAVQAFLVVLWMDGYRWLFLFGTLFNAIANFYPVVLQRTHRSQLAKMSAILSRTTA